MGKLIPAKERVFVSSSSKKKYEFLAGKGKDKKKLRHFKTQASLFDFCAALGIRDNQRIEVSDRRELVQSYSIDKDDALAMIVQSKNPELPPDQILRRLEEYAEYGINKIYDWVTSRGAKNIGDLHLLELLRLDLNGELTERKGVEEETG